MTTLTTEYIADLDKILSKPLTLGSERRALKILKQLGVKKLRAGCLRER
jgi:hypothetical protein